MNKHENGATRRCLTIRRSRLLLGVVCAAALVTALVSVPLASAAAHPDRVSARASSSCTTACSDVVGTGSFKCKTATGEVGYDPASGSGTDSSKTPDTIMIWFQATGCAGSAKPAVPKSVIASMSFPSRQGTTCPLGGTFGSDDQVTLAYNYPPVPATVIDPSEATVTVSNPGTTPYWTIKGTVTAGSYKGSAFSVMIKPDPIAPGACGTLHSEYITRLQGVLTV